MAKPSKNAALGFTLVAMGAGLSVAGLAVLAPVCYAWSRAIAETAFRKGKENVLVGIDGATEKIRQVAEAAQGPLGEAAKAARHTTVLAAGAVEAAARHVREHIE